MGDGRARPAVRPVPVGEIEAWFAVGIVERGVHGECAGGLIQCQQEQAVSCIDELVTRTLSRSASTTRL